MPIPLSPLALRSPLPDSPGLCRALEAIFQEGRHIHPDAHAFLHLEFQRLQEGHLALALSPQILLRLPGSSSILHRAAHFHDENPSPMMDAMGRALMFLDFHGNLYDRLIDIATRMAFDTDSTLAPHTKDAMPGLYAPISVVLAPGGALFYRPVLEHLASSPRIQRQAPILPPGLLRCALFPAHSAHGALRAHTTATTLAQALLHLPFLCHTFTLAA